MSTSNPLPPTQARLAALNRLKAKQKLTAAPPPEASGSNRNAIAGPSLVNKPGPVVPNARNAAQAQQEDQAPLKRDSSLVSLPVYRSLAQLII
jgi:DNA-repair protein complementing XP-A cells